jgi:hypothetical protein
MSVPVLSSSSQLSIQGVHASNISTTPIISSYPSSTTSTSLGHYHFVDDLTKASNHLNLSASSQGGHYFSHASATQTPKNILSLDRSGLYTDTQLQIQSSSTNCTTQHTSSQFYVLDNATSATGVLQSYLLQLANNTTTNKIALRNDDIPTTTATDISGNVSILSSVDLKFNNVSLPSTVSTNTQNIATNTANIATNTTDISNLKIRDLEVVVPQITLSSPAIYADSAIAPQPSPFLNTYGFSGWAYKKASPQASNAKINWYFPYPILNGTVGDLKGLYYQMFNNCAGVGDLGYFTVYTKPQGNSTDYRSWYHSSMTYVADSNSSPNQTCQMFANIKSLTFTPQSINIQNQISMSPSTVQNPKGDYQDNQQILFIAFGTNSASALNNVDFSVSKIGMITPNFSAEFLLL